MNYSDFNKPSYSSDQKRNRRKRAKRRAQLKRKRRLRNLISLGVFLFIFFIVGSGVISVGSKLFSKSKTDLEENKSKENIEDKVIVEKEDPVKEEEVKAKEESTPKEEVLVKENPLDQLITVKASEKVGLDYFNDAVFLGNSRTETFVLFTGLAKHTTSYAYKGFSVDKVFKKPVEIKGREQTVMDALKTTDFSKVYLMYGFNETGWQYPEKFIEKYAAIIDEIKNINPNAIIYVQSIIPVSRKSSEENEFENTERINQYNELVKEMVKEKDVHFLNVQESVIGDDGYLPEEASSDGVHLKREYADKWLDYLQTHTVKN